MTFEFFVESKFIPEHVEHKTFAGKTHYQAILKHLLRPETVNRVFNPRKDCECTAEIGAGLALSE